MQLTQPEIDSFANQLKQEDIDNAVSNARYQAMIAAIMDITSNSLLIQPTRFVLATRINRIKGLSSDAEDDELARLEQSTLDFLVKTNEKLSRLEQEIDASINECKEKGELFRILLMLMLANGRVKEMY